MSAPALRNVPKELVNSTVQGRQIVFWHPDRNPRSYASTDSRGSSVGVCTQDFGKELSSTKSLS